MDPVQNSYDSGSEGEAEWEDWNAADEDTSADEDMDLDFYHMLQIINYIRSEVDNNKCILCGEAFPNRELLLEHMTQKEHFKLPDAQKWSDEAYLIPKLESDPLLFGLDEAFNASEEEAQGAGESSEDLTARLRTENQGLHTELQDVRLQGGSGLRGVRSTPGTSEGAQQSEADRKRAEVDDDYFLGYSYFGIHREMLSDKMLELQAQMENFGVQPGTEETLKGGRRPS
eukprot:gene4292-5281_t